MIFSKFDGGDDFLPVNHILLLWKYYTYSQKCQKGVLLSGGSLLGLSVFTTLNLYCQEKRHIK